MQRRTLLAARARASRTPSFLLLLLCCCLAAWSPPAARALPLCTDGRAPVPLNRTLGFCSAYGGSGGGGSCCDAAADDALRRRFDAMNVSEAACASVVKSVLCAKCNPFSAELFNSSSKIRMVPLLCNYTSSTSTAQLKDDTQDYCKLVWETCKNVTIVDSPFQPTLQGSARPPSSSSKLTDVWQSEKDFCTSFGGSSDEQSLCFNGNMVSFNTSAPSPPPKGICVERIDNGSYLNMAPHPDGSNRVFLSNQAGKIWLATMPEQGSGGTLQYDEANPFLDLTDEVHHDSEFGLMGIAFHPKFATNGRFFVSYNCDRTQSSSCAGRCSCNSDADCDPSKLGADNGAQPCQYQVVVSEYSAKVSLSSNVSTARYANPSEVRRIFTMGLPFTAHHGGQILFGPTDGYLYLMMGDGGGRGDPFNFSQNKKSLLGKIMRLDIDGTQRQSQNTNQSLWGNYSIPKDNPFADDSELQPEIWAMGFSNPWRCSFDSERPSYFYCADVGRIRRGRSDLQGWELRMARVRGTVHLSSTAITRREHVRWLHKRHLSCHGLQPLRCQQEHRICVNYRRICLPRVYRSLLVWKVPVHRPVRVGDVGRNGGPGGQREVHLGRDALELLQEHPDRVRGRRRERRPAVRLQLLVRGGQPQGRVRAGEQGRVPGRQAQPVRLRLPRGGEAGEHAAAAVVRSGDAAGEEGGGGCSGGACNCVRVVISTL